MSDQNFVDYVKIHCKSGAGGAGSAHFLRDKISSKGGPDGGDGGKGGDVICRGNSQLWTLLHLKYRKHVIAEGGKPGTGNLKTGSDGEDVILEVPLGTVAKDPDTGEILFEITKHNEEFVLMPGGRGGWGNDHFKSPTNQTPQYAQPGEPFVEGWRILELKILADVGLVGFPNAGKSTLLASLSAAKPKIASYPFTTLTPNLGFVKYRDNRSFVIADIPGIIEDAHLGKGLGHRFLRHIERNAVLLFMVPCDTDDIEKEFRILMHELEMYNEELLDKPRLLAITKCDLIDDEMQNMLRPTLPEDIGVVFISAVSGFGLDKLKDMLWNLLADQTPNLPPAP
jgi:GTP-binding protein